MNLKLPEPISVDYRPSDGLRAVQSVECDILKKLLSVCQKHNLDLTVEFDLRHG